MQPRNARVDDGFDEDLKKALAMSLEEVNGHNGAGYVPQAAVQAPKPAANVTFKTPTTKPAEEEDDDLKAAIAASLADMEEQKSKHSATMKEQATSSTPQARGQSLKNNYELTPVEAENINLFSTLVDRLQTQPPGTILREPQIQELYESIGKLRPKLARTYGETMSKHGKCSQTTWHIEINNSDALLDLHAKLSTVVRYYDRMLEYRLSNTYNQHSIGGYNLPSQRSTSTMYPSLASNAAPGTAENYYTGNQQEPYARPQSTYSYPPQQFQQYDNRAPVTHSGYPEQRNDVYSQHVPQPSMQPQRTGSMVPEPITQYAPQAASPMHAPSQPPLLDGPLAPLASPSADPNAAFYYGNPAQAAPSAEQPQYAPAQQSPQQYHTTIPQPVSPVQAVRQPHQNQQQFASPQQTLATLPQQPPQQYMPPPQQPAPVPQQQPQAQQAPYWQQQSAAPQPWQNSGQTYSGYTQESFPSTPQHVIQQKVPVMEESLIDL